jgi:hypothetical protein
MPRRSWPTHFSRWQLLTQVKTKISIKIKNPGGFITHSLTALTAEARTLHVSASAKLES